MTYFFVELKTTGLNPNTAKICYLNFVVYKDDVQIANFESWVDVGDVLWDREAYFINFQDYSTKVKCTYKDLKQALLEFLSTYITDKAFIVAYEANFHQSFIIHFLGREDFDKYFWSVPICVLQKLNLLLQNVRYKLPNMKFATMESLFSLKKSRIENLITLFYVKE